MCALYLSLCNASFVESKRWLSLDCFSLSFYGLSLHCTWTTSPGLCLMPVFLLVSSIKVYHLLATCPRVSVSFLGWTKIPWRLSFFCKINSLLFGRQTENVDKDSVCRRWLQKPLGSLENDKCCSWFMGNIQTFDNIFPQISKLVQNQKYWMPALTERIKKRVFGVCKIK